MLLASVTDLDGIGPAGAARLLVEIGDLTRFPSKAHFASWAGTAPIDASFGNHVRHRLSRTGNRQINRVLRRPRQGHLLVIQYCFRSSWSCVTDARPPETARPPSVTVASQRPRGDLQGYWFESSRGSGGRERSRSSLQMGDASEITGSSRPCSGAGS